MKLTSLFALVFAICLPLSVNAGGMQMEGNVGSSGGCSYTEYMHINGPQGTHILQLFGTLQSKQVSPIDFQIIGVCEGVIDGIVTAKIGIDESHYSLITIKDGQFMWNPEIINIEPHGGYVYTGIEHRTFTYDYTLNFQFFHS